MAKAKRFGIYGLCLAIALYLTGFILHSYGAAIESFNSSLRSYAMGNGWGGRDFAADGMPTSVGARMAGFVSPFYVVHYGLIYSESLRTDFPNWPHIDSLWVWDYPPPAQLINKMSFKAAVERIADQIKIDKFNIGHIYYDFDWPYANFPGGKLTAPWWSGLTDCYALELLGRGSDAFNEPQLLEKADSLYRGCTSNISAGGNLRQGDGYVWIEEYLDKSSLKKAAVSSVLNGMLYATFAVLNYEKRRFGSQPSREVLCHSIEKRAPLYDADGWTYYDDKGSLANIKYNTINYAGLLDVNKLCRSDSLQALAEKWKNYKTPYFVNILRTHDWSWGFFHNLISATMILAVIFTFLLFAVRKIR